MNERNEFRPEVDFGKSFDKLTSEMQNMRPCSIWTINGMNIEILPGQTARWGKFTGTFPEVAEKIREAGMALKNSIKTSPPI